MLEILFNIAPIFLAILVTSLYKSRGLLPKNFSEVTSFIAFRIVIPVLLFQILTTADFSALDWSLFAFSALLVCSLLLSGKLLANLSGTTEEQQGVLHFSQLDFYVYGFGMPFILVNFSAEVVSRIVVMDLVVFVSYLFLGGFLASVYSKNSLKLWPVIRENTIQSMFFWTILISVGVNLLNFPVPERIYELSDFFSSSFGLLVALLIGSSLSLPDLTMVKKHLLAYSTRLLVVAALILLATQLLPLSDNDTTAMWLTFMTPIGSFGLLFATKYKLDKNYFAQLHIFSFMASLILYPILIVWLKS